MDLWLIESSPWFNFMQTYVIRYTLVTPSCYIRDQSESNNRHRIQMYIESGDRIVDLEWWSMIRSQSWRVSFRQWESNRTFSMMICRDTRPSRRLILTPQKLVSNTSHVNNLRWFVYSLVDCVDRWHLWGTTIAWLLLVRFFIHLLCQVLCIYVVCLIDILYIELRPLKN